MKDGCKDRPLYQAMKEYGIENFSVETLEETENPEEREKYWIEYFSSFKNGYNATIGGDGKLPNQSYYHTSKIISNDKEDVHFIVRWVDILKASKELTANGMKLYLYLAKNPDGYSFYFSPADFCQTYDITDRTFRRAREELVEKGYLQKGEHNNVFFNAGGLGDSVEFLRKKIIEISKLLKEENDDLFEEYYSIIVKAKLKEIEDENLYKTKAKEIINLGEDFIRTCTKAEIENLI